MLLRCALLVAVLLLCAGVQAQMSGDLPSAPQPVMWNAVPDAPPAPDLALAPVSATRMTVPLASPLMIAPAQPKVPTRKVIDRKFIVLNAMHFALTAADIEMTQHCMAAKKCVELNPTLPKSRWGMYAVNTMTNTAVTYLSYRRRKAGKWDWWIAPTIDIGAHAVGVGSNLRFVW